MEGYCWTCGKLGDLQYGTKMCKDCLASWSTSQEEVIRKAKHVPVID